MKSVAIVGNNSFAELIKAYIDEQGDYEVLAYCVESAYIDSNELGGIPVVSLEELFALYPPEKVDLILAIGYKQMGGLRKRLFGQLKKQGYHFISLIHHSAIISRNVKMGEGNIVLEGVIIEPNTSIGDANLFFGGAIIAHNNELGNYNTLSVRATLAGNCKVANNCFFGANSTVKDAISIPSYVLVGAGTYVSNAYLSEYQVIASCKGEVLEGKNSLDIY